jgi:chromosome segregation ATPase
MTVAFVEDACVDGQNREMKVEKQRSECEADQSGVIEKAEHSEQMTALTNRTIELETRLEAVTMERDKLKEELRETSEKLRAIEKERDDLERKLVEMSPEINSNVYSQVGERDSKPLNAVAEDGEVETDANQLRINRARAQVALLATIEKSKL